MESNPRLVVNRATCLLCGTIVTSKTTHDFVSCKCGSLSVDGGQYYTRRLFKSRDDFKELSLYEDSPWEDVRMALTRGSRGVDGKQPLTWIPLCDIDDSYLHSLIEYCGQLEQNDINYWAYCKEREYRNTLEV